MKPRIVTAAAPSSSVMNAIQMEVEAVNAAGGVNGRLIELAIEDNGSELQKAAAAADLGRLPDLHDQLSPSGPSVFRQRGSMVSAHLVMLDSRPGINYSAFSTVNE